MHCQSYRIAEQQLDPRLQNRLIHMKRKLLVLLAACSFAWAGERAVSAQVQPPPPEDKGKPEKPGKPPEKPGRPDKEDKDELLDTLTKGFKDKAAEYQAKQKDVLAALKGAKGEEREKLRDALKALQEEFKEEKERFKDEVKEAREKLSDLKSKLEEEAREERDRSKPRDRDR
jgi:gas vesicle protein